MNDNVAAPLLAPGEVAVMPPAQLALTGWARPRVKRLRGQTTLHFWRGQRTLCPRYKAKNKPTQSHSFSQEMPSWRNCCSRCYERYRYLYPSGGAQ